MRRIGDALGRVTSSLFNRTRRALTQGAASTRRESPNSLTQKLSKDKIIIEKETFINNGNAINDSDIINLYNKAYKPKEPLIEFTPNTDDGGEALIWKIKLKDTPNELIGFCVTTDLEQFKKYDNFESKGGIKEAKGLFITSVAGNSDYKGIVGLLFEEIIKYAESNKYDYLLLEAKKYEPINFLVKLYEKQGFKSIKEMPPEDDGEVGTLMCRNISENFNCYEKILSQLKIGGKRIKNISKKKHKYKQNSTRSKKIRKINSKKSHKNYIKKK
jgi:hypothetical protein